MVVSFAKLIGVLEPIGPAAHGARLVALAENLLAHAQCTKNLGPPAVGTRLEFLQTRFKLEFVHDGLRLDDTVRAE